jgi:hypothetical protein
MNRNSAFFHYYSQNICGVLFILITKRNLRQRYVDSACGEIE